MENPLTTTYNAEIGNQHNEIITTWIANTTIEQGLSFAEKVDGVKSYLLAQHEVDVSPMIESWLNEGGGGIISGSAYLEKHKENVSTYLHGQLSNVYSETNGKPLNIQKQVAVNYLAQIPEDGELSQGEKNLFLNMMTVFRDSADLWLGIENDPPQTFGFWDSIPKSAYKKIAWTDVISGIAGGLMGGGPGGALIGIVSGSLISAINHSEW